ncbi:MAG: hypothetical protein R3C39_00195 [Dehalococcoidia bacterium]
MRKRTLAALSGGALALFVLAGVAYAVVDAVTPSTNDINKAKTPTAWAHVNQLSQGIGETELEFVSERNFYSCFEYRTDGDTSQMTGPTNPNSGVTDGLYPYVCRFNDTSTMTFSADEYVEVRMVFGGETDERFDWTRFDVLPDVQTKDQCMNGGWEAFGFSNQGLCIQFVNTGKDSRS